MNYFFKNIRRKPVAFKPIDPLGGGLSEAIALEKQEPQAIRFDDHDEHDIHQFWQTVQSDLQAGGGLEYTDAT